MNIEGLLAEDKLLEIARSYLTDKSNFNNTRGKGNKGQNGLLYAISKKQFKKALKKDQIDDFGIDKMPDFIDGPRKPGVYGAMWPDYWNRLKREIYYLICTNDRKYREVRKIVRAEGKKAQTAIVSTVAAAVAVHLGIAAGALVPFCALVLVSTFAC